MAAVADSELAKLFDAFARTAFRLELLAAYMAGEPRPPSPEREQRYAMIAGACAAGRTCSGCMW